MTAFNFFSRGTQDLYPTFLQAHKLSVHEVGLIAVIYNIGAIIGGIASAPCRSGSGRCRTIILAAVLSLFVLPLWAFSTSALWLSVGAFLMQVMVQGAWGVIPLHLNELSPEEARGTFPGFTYQIGNLTATLQAGLAAHFGGDYGFALALVAGIVAVTIIILAALGSEARGVKFGTAGPPPRRHGDRLRGMTRADQGPRLADDEIRGLEVGAPREASINGKNSKRSILKSWRGEWLPVTDG